MPEFLELLPPEEALGRLLSELPIQLTPENVKTEASLGRVTAEPVVAAHPLPSFDRSTVDGYAVRAANTHGAGEALPAYLNVVGEVPMGAVPAVSLEQGQCALIHTGGMLPPGADAVVMIEYSQLIKPVEVEILHSVAVGENVIKVGEDVKRMQEVFPIGTRFRSAEIGGAMALGITDLNVTRKPRLGILSTGDEVIPPEEEIQPGQVRDINSYTLSALVVQAGGVAIRYGIISDQADAVYTIAKRALEECDIVVITAGSSASVRDVTSQVIERLGTPGVLVHGVNVRPGKPTILGVCDGKAVIGLPGNPVSALVIAWLFVVPIIEALLGVQHSQPPPSIQARLTVNLASQAGREDWVPVRLIREKDGYIAEPVFGKSNLIFTLARADGLLRISSDANGMNAGEIVQVRLF
ncbi:MAG: molybdopterin-binding protein [Anaerolineales bacterium]|nr:molybdopterin-binding protein [Anaerolineales bacterium]